MKRTYLLCILVGALFCSIAWLLGLFFGQALFPVEYEIVDLETDVELLAELGEDFDNLPLNESPSIESLLDLEDYYGLIIETDRNALLQHKVSLDKGNSAARQSEIVNESVERPVSVFVKQQDKLASESQASSEVVKIADDSKGGQWISIADSYDEMEFHRQDGSVLFVSVPQEEDPLFFAYEIFQWILQLMAVLATLAISWLILQSRLKKLDGATREANLLSATEQATDPIEAAIAALYRARDSIGSLTDARTDDVHRHRDLLASVAHEFRNPLARLQFANEMAQDACGEEQQTLLQQSNAAAVELDGLVRETLNYSRLTMPDNGAQITEVSLTDVFRDLASRHVVITGDNKNTLRGTDEAIEFYVDYPIDDVIVYADQRLLIRALDNLLGNALRYASSRVTLSSSGSASSAILPQNLSDGAISAANPAANSAASMVNIIVEDDGPGIAVEHHNRIFEPFYRIEPSRSRSTGGFGLGLSIVKSIAVTHRAQVRLEQASIGGCRFVLEWPLCQEPLSASH